MITQPDVLSGDALVRFNREVEVQRLLNEGDMHRGRVIEIADCVTPEWKEYFRRLRLARSDPSMPIPERPPYPLPPSLHDDIVSAGDAQTKPLGYPDEADALTKELELLRVENAELRDQLSRADFPQSLPPDPSTKMSDYVPAEIRSLMEEGETFTQARKRLSELLNVELAELKNLRGMAGEDLVREADVERLLGLFARLGEI